ncbi:MAG: hypothetical protein RMK18_01535 [Armatimonadota bacterium]|nr:hypothetical protein [Armatimonadota bacterium]MDW8024537.1 hypothetical protein [Armatimonadota bacterium]
MPPFNVWLVVANERIKGKEEGWHWDDFFLHRGEWAPSEFSWGGYEWIRSPLSLKCIREMKRGDIVIAYQAGEGIIGLCLLASSGYEEVPGSGDINTFDLAPEPALRLQKAVPISQLKSDSRTALLVRQLQGSVFKATDFWEALKQHILTANPHLNGAMRRFERMAQILRRTHGEEKDIWRKMEIERSQTYRWRGRICRRRGERSAWLRKLYDFKCQICLLQFPMPDGRMLIEVHYLKPLTLIGPLGDHPGNMLVLCPNHHLQLELGEDVHIDWDSGTIQVDGAQYDLTIHPLHAQLAITWREEYQLMKQRLEEEQY